MSQREKAYNLRVYGLIIRSGRILITEEFRAGMEMVKFPGGGLEWGEGLADGLKREFDEELGLTIENLKLFYVNDYFQQSAFRDSDQLISFYFHCDIQDEDAELDSFDSFRRNDQLFRWVELKDLKPLLFTFPIDQKVGELLNSAF